MAEQTTDEHIKQRRAIGHYWELRLIARIAALEKRLALWAEYVDWLDKANKAPIQLAWLHGWRCSDEDIKKGDDYRKRLARGEGEGEGEGEGVSDG